MVDVDLEAPELDDIDENAPAYKRAVAVLVVLITLFGSIVAYLQARESNDEDVAARDAQRFAVAGLGAQVDASADFAADLRVGSEIDAALQRQALNAGRVDNFEGGPDDTALAAAQRFAAVREAIAELTPVDPTDPATAVAEFALGNESADAARLRQTVEAQLADDHGGKADAYVAVLTVLAVALFLLGLSLTVQGRSRYVLAAPGVAIALVCVGWTAIIASRAVTRVSATAIADVAEGLRLANAGDLEAAIDAYDDAIDDSPDFAIAYARRGSARFVQGSGQVGQTSFLSLTSEEALEDALADLDEAIERGADADVEVLADAGFFAFLAGDFDRSADLSSDALELNDQLAAVWFNLGVAEVARGDDGAARRAYREGKELLEDSNDVGTRIAVLAGARTDLSILRELLDGDDLDDVEALIEAIEADLAAFDAAFVDPEAPRAEADGVGEAELTRSGATVFASVEIEGAEPGTPITAVWYLRTGDDQPFQQAAFPLEVVGVGDDGTVLTSTLPSFDPACPVPGDYLVRLYAGDEPIGEAQASIEAGPLGGAFFAEVDPIEGYEACVPEGFEVLRADVTELDAFTSFANGELNIGLNVTPGIIADGSDADALNARVTAQTLGIPEDELLEVTLNARDVDGFVVALPALAGVSADGDFMIVGANGPDGARRNITIIGSGDLAVLDEAIGLIQFTGLPAA